jgi:hypothetical protein
MGHGIVVKVMITTLRSRHTSPSDNQIDNQVGCAHPLHPLPRLTLRDFDNLKKPTFCDNQDLLRQPKRTPATTFKRPFDCRWILSIIVFTNCCDVVDNQTPSTIL